VVEVGDPQVGADALGEAVVVWAQDTGQDSGWDIYARMTDPEGVPIGAQHQVNTEALGDQLGPVVGVNPAGDYAIAWSSGEEGIFGRFYEAGGRPLGPEFPMVESEGGLVPVEPEISVGGDDTVSLSYARVDAAGVGQGVYLRTFDVTSPPGTCEADQETACLNSDRFQVSVSWRDFTDRTGAGMAVSNVELMLKVLDGTGVNGHFWVFYGALSNVEYTIVVTDTLTGGSVTYLNPEGTFASVGDSEAIPADGSGRQKTVVVDHGSIDLGALELYQRLVEDDGASGKVAPQGTCTPAARRLCLNNERFAVEAIWRDFSGNTGEGQAVPLTSDTGTFWFFSDANVELVLKVLDGTGINGHYWVFYGALSNVEYTITVTDTVTGAVRTYENPLGEFGSGGDTEAFAGG